MTNLNQSEACVGCGLTFDPMSLWHSLPRRGSTSAPLLHRDNLINRNLIRCSNGVHGNSAHTHIQMYITLTGCTHKHTDTHTFIRKSSVCVRVEGNEDACTPAHNHIPDFPSKSGINFQPVIHSPAHPIRHQQPARRPPPPMLAPYARQRRTCERACVCARTYALYM